MTATDCKCGGTGRLTYDDKWHPNQPAALCSAICECRKSLPPREGKASWWTVEVIKTMEFESATKFDTVTANIDRERPISEDNYRLIRSEENVYWPTMATLDAEFSSTGFTSDMLRDLAKWLNEVADEVDRIDGEVS